MAQQVLGWAGSRRLLRVLRDIMKGGGTAQERLDQIVRLIAQDMVAEVCSVYVMRAGEVLELFATQGLKPEAVHTTRLRNGEGLVGNIALNARPLRLADAQNHPDFAYRPETGEDPFQSLMGVPILRDGRVLGVLVIQNATQRNYAEEELETLETVAMVLAELVASGELVSAEESQSDTAALLPVRLPAIVLNDGLGLGRIVLHERGIVIRQTVAEEPDAEHERLRAAVAEMHSALDELMRQASLATSGGEHEEVLASYRMFAEDRGWLNRIREAVNGGLTAEAAVQKVQNDTRARMAEVRDPYIRERLSDLDDLANRLLHHLTGGDGGSASDNLPEDIVLLARTLGPAELLDYDRERLRAVVLEEGSPTAHVAVVARALDIPVLGRCRGALAEARAGDEALVDGDTGQFLLRPAESVRDSFAESMAARARRSALYAETRDLPPVTRDGTRVNLFMNAGLLVDLPQLEESGADGIGLYRTEVPFMVRREFPDVAAQTRLYARVLEQTGDKPVVFRTLDVGGDKALPYWRGHEEENPAMGWRALRIGLDRPVILRQQLRALLRAAQGRELRIMFPMVTEVAELERARALVDLERDRAEAQGQNLPSAIRVGAMMEVPALLWQLPQLFRTADFVAVGSNDLFQYVFASDRGNPRLARRYDPLSPPGLRLLLRLSQEADKAGVDLSVCGEMAGQPVDALALIGCGLRNLSMAPRAVPAIRATVRSLDLPPLARLMRELAEANDHSVRERLRGYAMDRGIAI
jgi:phosphotransferase system enzyme I (PtsP)